jgi:DNA (cytosine-5)-methyltransferase 1
MATYNFIDAFAGCGGLSEGFKATNQYKTLAAIEWEKPQVLNLINRLKTRWDYSNAEELVMRFDIQRTEELLNGWSDDEDYGTHPGLTSLIKDKEVDVVIGGPPCQAYSMAGRIRDENGMREDYRNYLFESYLKIISAYRPKVFVFENVPGMLSAAPGGISVTTLIKEAINDLGYTIIDDLRTHAQINLAEYGVPQIRKRVILIGLRNDLYENPQEILLDFYSNILPQYKEVTRTVKDAFSGLPRLYPLDELQKKDGKKLSHSYSKDPAIKNHLPRFHSTRDIEVFRMLAEDIETGRNEYTTTEALRNLYTQLTGRNSNVHKYHVLRWNKPSNTIPAHLYKDGLRHIHPDSEQCRSITVREAARLQTFPDDYEFISSAGDNYKMIGNAVPPKFSEKLANALSSILN